MTEAAMAEPSGAPIEHVQSTPNPAEPSNPAAKGEETTEGQPPSGEERRSIKDSIEAARKKVEAESAKEDAAEKKPEAKEAKPTAEKEPAKPDPKEAKSAAERAADGKFKSARADVAEEPAKPVQRQSAHPEAPSRFDDAAKAEWESVGENTRGAVHRMQRELEQGIEKYRKDAEAFEPLRQYHDLARQNGTDLKTALDRYNALEDELLRDPISGMQSLISQLGLRGPNGQPATLRDIAAHVLGQKPDQVASRQEATISSLKGEIADLKRQLGGVSQQMQQQAEAAKIESLTAEWQGFAAQNPNAAVLEAEMAEFLTKYPAPETPVRERLSDALAWAEARHPDKIAAHTRDDDVAAQTRDKPAPNPAGQKSISGAPASGSDPTLPATPKGQKSSISDSIKRARAKHGV